MKKNKKKMKRLTNRMQTLFSIFSFSSVAWNILRWFPLWHWIHFWATNRCQQIDNKRISFPKKTFYKIDYYHICCAERASKLMWISKPQLSTSQTNIDIAHQLTIDANSKNQRDIAYRVSQWHVWLLKIRIFDGGFSIQHKRV